VCYFWNFFLVLIAWLSDAYSLVPFLPPSPIFKYLLLDPIGWVHSVCVVGHHHHHRTGHLLLLLVPHHPPVCGPSRPDPLAQVLVVLCPSVLPPDRHDAVHCGRVFRKRVSAPSCSSFSYALLQWRPDCAAVHGQDHRPAGGTDLGLSLCQLNHRLVLQHVLHRFPPRLYRLHLLQGRRRPSRLARRQCFRCRKAVSSFSRALKKYSLSFVLSFLST